MFEPPLQYCAVIKEYVALNEPQQDCRRMHRCDPDWACFVFPLVAHGESSAGSKADFESKRPSP
jgi:hypothetical protein